LANDLLRESPGRVVVARAQGAASSAGPATRVYRSALRMIEIALGFVLAGPALMVVGTVVMITSLLRRRVGFVFAARLVLLGPALGTERIS
jgi:hypothetical protein